jgi:DNA-binding transcriptional ArsR family regulator
MQFRELSPERLDSAANMLKAIAHPLRISILTLLEGGNMLTVSEIQTSLNIEQSTTSHHLGILKDKGILASKRDGRNILYMLRNEHLSTLVECLGKFN